MRGISHAPLILLLAVMAFSSIFLLGAVVAADSSENSNSSNGSFSVVIDNRSQNSENTNTLLTPMATEPVLTPVAENSQEDSIIEIPDTSESPLALKTHIIDEMKSLVAGGGNAQLAEIIEHLRKSIDNNFWDDYHIKSGEAFKEDKYAAQKMRVLLDSEGKSDLNNEVLLECLIMLLQADKKLASGAIEDTKNALIYINDQAALDEISREIENAVKEYNNSEEHIWKGDHVIALGFFGKAWEHAYAAISTADRSTIPKITLSSPGNGSYTNLTLQTIAGGVEDVALYTIKNVTLTVNMATSEIPLLDGEFSQQVMFVEGTNTIKVSVKDAFGNPGEAEALVTLDTIAPEIEIAGVEDGEYHNSDVLPEIKVSDTNLMPPVITLDGIPYYSGTTITEEGVHVLEIYASDLAGNSAYRKIKFTIDKNPPKVELTSPQNNTHVRRSVEIKGSINDINLEDVSLRIDNFELSNGIPYAWDTTRYADGVHKIELYAADKALNNATVTIYVTIDNTPPSVALTSPDDGAFVRQNMSIEGSTTDANLASTSLFINGQEVSTSLPYKWETTSSADGKYQVELIASDLAGNQARTNITATVDNTLSGITILFPSDYAYLRHGVEVNASVIEANLQNISVRINGSEVSQHLPYLWDTLEYQDSRYKIEVYALDKAGNEALEGINVTVDNTPPEVSFLNPLNNSYLSMKYLTLLWGGSDNYGIAIYELFLNNTLLDRTTETSKGLENLEDRSYETTVQAFDLANNSASDTIRFTIDTVPPEIKITGVEDSRYYNTSVTPSLEITDSNLDTQSITLNGAPYTSGTVVSAEGSYALVVSATDKAGNSDSKTVNFVIDKTKPGIDISGVSNGSHYNIDVIPVITITDSNLDTQSITLNGAPFMGGTVVSSEGSYTLVASATDKAGNSDSKTVNFVVDKTKPGISISGVTDGSYYNLDVTPVITITDSNLNFTEVTLDGNSYNVESISAEGRHSLKAYAEDLAGNNATSIINFTIDKTPPDVSLISPSENSFLNRIVVVTGSATDVNLDKAALRINGVEVADSLPYAWNTSQFPDGAYTVELSAVDKAGNSNLTSSNVTVDNTHPAVSITEPQDRAFVRGTIQINGMALDVNSGAVSLKIDSGTVSSALPYAWDTSGYGDGAHSIELSAVDKAGNNASTAITVVVDNAPPQVSLAAPANNSYVSQIVSIEGDAADSNLNKTGLSIDGTEVSSSLPYYWNTNDYTDGEHTLSLSAWDMAGNEAAVEIMVTVDNTAPIVSIISPLDGALLRQTVEINGTITEMNTHLISLKIDGAGAAGSIPYLWDTTAYTDGAHSIELNVSDKASNYAEASVNVTIDNTPPLLAVSELNLNPTLYNAEYSLLITAEADAVIDVNDTPVALDNGSGLYRTNVTSGINEFTVTAIDLAGNPSVWKRRILVDEDALPDWYETNVTGTDPLDGDSDSSLTLADEADNGIKDDAEDFDSDRLSNREEFAYGLDTFKSDTEGDGLIDWYELRVSGTNPLLLDSDNNSVNDQNEDKDGDLLNNLMEQGYNTNPLSNDTDEDGLSDYREIMELKTDPLKKDTDNDFLDDSIELKPFFNTDPNNPDTNNNGILDGNETYEQTVGNKALGVEVVINASDNREGTFIFEDVGDKLKIDSDVFIGKPINILAREKFSNMKIKMYYDAAGIKNESDLAIFYFDEKNHSFVLLENQSVNTEENYILAETNHLSDFVPGSIQGYNNQFLNSNAPTIAELKAGDEIKINARVHNIGIGEAKDVAVDFYNGDPGKGGMFIGRNVTASIGGNRSALASVKWKVNFIKGMNIFVKVDPNSTVVETREDNNIAGRFLDNKSIDSDSDGLTDYDEINGLRTGMHVTFFTDPNDPDTDDDGLDDGKEMGRVMIGSQGSYYYLFSYPNLTDSDDDHLSDKDEYDFGSSGIYKDTDYDRLSDFEEYQLGTLPRDPDTDRDGLTDWWETVTDASINKYGATDPKNRDSDGDGAIDGGEVNVYNGTLHMGMAVDTNKDGVVDSGEMDLNGDDIIEMGEENYYETPPNEVTYFLDIFVVADSEYRDYYKRPENTDYYKKWINYSVDRASVYFMKEFDIRLKVVEISEKVWNSDGTDIDIWMLRQDAVADFNWNLDRRNADVLIAFTGKDPYVEGVEDDNTKSIAVQIPEIDDPEIYPYAYSIKNSGFWRYIPDDLYNYGVQLYWDPYLVQHEVSHIFGAYDYGTSPYREQDQVTGDRLARIYSIMDKTKPSEDPYGFLADPLGNIWFTHKWNPESIDIINHNKTIATGGPYKKHI